MSVKCVLFNFIAMCPSDKRPRLYVFGAANKREKKRRLDNAVTGTSKIQSFFETTKAGGRERAKSKLLREIQEMAIVMRLTLHPQYQRLKMKQRRNQQR